MNTSYLPFSYDYYSINYGMLIFPLMNWLHTVIDILIEWGVFQLYHLLKLFGKKGVSSNAGTVDIGQYLS